MTRIFRRKSFFLAAAAVSTIAFGIWITPVTYEAQGTVAVADDSGADQSTYSNDCSDVVWPNIPTECLKNADGGQSRRVIMIGESRQG